MHVRPDGAAAEALEARVVDPAQHGLDDEGGERDEAEDGVQFGVGVGQLRGAGGLVVPPSASLPLAGGVGASHQAAPAKGDGHHLDEVDAEGGGDDEDDKAGELGQGVEPDGEAAGDDAHHDGADGEQHDEGERGQDAVDGCGSGWPC